MARVFDSRLPKTMSSFANNSFCRYVKASFWNTWGPLALFKRLMNRPVPSANFSANGYTIPEIGPNFTQGKGQKEHDEVFDKLKEENRAGCPFGFVN